MCLIAKLWERPPRFAVLPNDFADKHISDAYSFCFCKYAKKGENELGFILLHLEEVDVLGRVHTPLAVILGGEDL